MIKNNKNNQKVFNKDVNTKTISWTAFRILSDELNEFTIDEEFKNKFFQKIDSIYNMNELDKVELIKKWMEKPYIYTRNTNKS